MTESTKTGVEIERKYIIKMPDRSTLQIQSEYTESNILQIYLEAPKGETHRIRCRSYSDITRFYETRKIRIDRMSSTEIEGEISKERFDELSKQIKLGSIPIVKARHTFLYSGQLFEIDIYPQWKHTAIMETELSSRDEVVRIPSFIKIIREVTGEKSYSNASMSISFPIEDNI